MPSSAATDTTPHDGEPGTNGSPRLPPGIPALVAAEPGRAGVQLGKLEVLAGVHEFPARVKCATLAWHTMQAALENSAKPISTE